MRNAIYGLLFMLLSLAAFGQTAPAFVQVQRNTAFSTSITTTITASTAGNTIIVAFLYNRTLSLGTVTGPANFTLAAERTASGNDNNYMAIWYRANAPSTTGVQVSVSNTANLWLHVMEVSGVDPTTPVGYAGSAPAQSSSTVPFVATGTLPYQPAMAFNVAFNEGGELTNWSGGETERSDQGYVSTSTEDIASTASYTAAASLTGVANMTSGFTVVLRGVPPVVSSNNMLMATD